MNNVDSAFEILMEYLQSVSSISWFWLAAGLCLLVFLPRGRLAALVLCALIAFLPPGVSFVLLLFVAAIAYIRFGVRRVPEGSACVVLRLGKYSRTMSPGLHLLIPGLERIHVPVGLATIAEDGSQVPLVDKYGFITVREFVLDPPPHDMILQDNSVVNVDSIAFLRIASPRMAVFGVENLGDSVLKLIETVLRQEIGKLNADEVIGSRDVIGSKLQQALSLACEPWGTIVVRIEIQAITFKSELQEALSKAREQELEGRAKVVAAERERDAQIARAEGDKRAAELTADAELALARARAEAEFLSESKRREGEAQGLRAISDALRESPQALLSLESIKQQPEIAKGLASSDGLLVVPAETAGLIGVAATMVKSLGVIRSHSSDHRE
jgi:regulator of protease activity HflC (stomatin/prohibitin superfamily)